MTGTVERVLEVRATVLCNCGRVHSLAGWAVCPGALVPRSLEPWWRAKKYLVRQYRPAYFSGFETEVAKGVEYDKITAQPWFANFKHDGFTEFTIELYNGDELIISAHYANGEHWVAGFALPEDSKQISNNGDLLRDKLALQAAY